MKWRGRQASSNVEDRRGGGGPGKKTALGLGGLVVVIIVALLGGNPNDVIQALDQNQPTENSQPVNPNDDAAQFVAVVLKDTETVWTKIFNEQLGKSYELPTLVIFDGEVRSACGQASAATGPFYCPADYKLYIDLSFYRDLRDKLGAPGDFAMAYVIAHEVGHHVQNLLGVMAYQDQQRQKLSKTAFNKISVRTELQADFYAGVWAHHADKINKILEPGDIEEALNAANAIGDDRLQKEFSGRVVPESFTHGTSAQRVNWFSKGYKTGDISQGNTFEAYDL